MHMDHPYLNLATITYPRSIPRVAHPFLLSVMLLQAYYTFEDILAWRKEVEGKYFDLRTLNSSES